MTHQITAADLAHTLEQVDFANGQPFHHGKVRDSFVLDAERRAIVVTDRVSAFDFVLGTIPCKGQVLNQLAAWWFRQLDDINIPHHLLEVPHPNISVVRNVTPLPIEIVVRAYLTGTTTTSSWYAYQHNNRELCGITLPAGMVKNQAFAAPILTPTTKPEVGHDRNISPQEILDEALVRPEIFRQAQDYALRLFAHGQKIAAQRGLILVDTKYEMGLTPKGELLVIDEVHTPDSSRYWVADSYPARFAAGQEPESLDKEFVRRMVVGAGYDVDDGTQNPKDFMTDEVRLAAAQKYLALFEQMTGRALKWRENVDLKSDINTALAAL